MEQISPEYEQYKSTIKKAFIIAIALKLFTWGLYTILYCWAIAIVMASYFISSINYAKKIDKSILGDDFFYASTFSFVLIFATYPDITFSAYTTPLYWIIDILFSNALNADAINNFVFILSSVVFIISAIGLIIINHIKCEDAQ